MLLSPRGLHSFLPPQLTPDHLGAHSVCQVLDAGGEAAVAAVAGELALIERALQKNPKSYSAWHHRRWIVAKGFCSLERELQLVRLWVCACACVPVWLG